MKKVTLCLEFRGGKGHAYVNVVPSNYGIEKVAASGCIEYELASPGTYTIMFEGNSPAGGTTATLYIDDAVFATRTISSEGYYSRYFKITI
ncbi:hypothetical protein [Chitinophaga sp. 212800010-3]|uniref:hypothetical protein n=1 Tax=unclassified Chitinophaga TaxID=2619133 RepID=UPI002DE83CAB|nr:hypothetical protein [Chitinophaga sp. 212800010-3]